MSPSKSLNPPAENPDQPPSVSKSFGKPISHAFLTVSALLCLCLMLCYWLRPDAFAAPTILPVACWFLLGLLMTRLGWGWYHQSARKAQAVGALWLLFLLLFADEPRSLFRAFLPSPAADEALSLRVVSLNCSAGDPLAAAEVQRWKPDVVLLQESPARADVEELTRRLWGKDGSFVWGVDGSILARGKLTPRPLPRALANYFVQAHLQLPQGPQVEVFSLRLMTPPFRVDLWSPACWGAYSHNRELQTVQMNAIKAQLDALPTERAILLGGDFNAPQGDAIFGTLRPRLQDSFARAGRGLGNTIINEFPALRIDQIWTSGALQPRDVRARPTQNSDHRAVVADFLWSAG